MSASPFTHKSQIRREVWPNELGEQIVIRGLGFEVWYPLSGDEYRVQRIRRANYSLCGFEGVEYKVINVPDRKLLPEALHSDYMSNPQTWTPCE